MNRLDFTYLEQEDTLILRLKEPGEATISLPKNVLKTVFTRVEEEFSLSLSMLTGETTLRMLVIKDAGPAALRLTEELAERIKNFTLSWDGRDLKIECIKLDEKPLELSFIKVPLGRI
ncbi:MAG: hypothetical protein QXF52_01985 [Thermoproteota archaeon]